MNTEPKPKNGGARKGAGRKRGRNTVYMTFTIPITTAQILAEVALNKSRFVNEAILKAIGPRSVRQLQCPPDDGRDTRAKEPVNKSNG